MPRGRKRTPTPLLVLRGSRLAKERAGEIAPAPAALTPPAYLPARAREHWQATAPALSALGLLSILDVTVWAAACTLWARAMDFHDMLETDGLVLEGDGGSLRIHPAIRAQHKCYETYLKIASDFGSTPRARVGLPVPLQGPDELDIFLQGRRPVPRIAAKPTQGE